MCVWKNVNNLKELRVVNVTIHRKGRDHHDGRVQHRARWSTHTAFSRQDRPYTIRCLTLLGLERRFTGQHGMVLQRTHNKVFWNALAHRSGWLLKVQLELSTITWLGLKMKVSWPTDRPALQGRICIHLQHGWGWCHNLDQDMRLSAVAKGCHEMPSALKYRQSSVSPKGPITISRLVLVWI